MAGISSNFETTSVLGSMGIFSCTVGALFVCALLVQKSVKMLRTLLIGLVFTSVLQIFVLIALLMTGTFSDVTLLFFCILGAIGAGIYVICDLMLVIVPGNLDKDDYILASLNLYVDLVRLFIYILEIFGERR